MESHLLVYDLQQYSSSHSCLPFHRTSRRLDCWSQRALSVLFFLFSLHCLSDTNLEKIGNKKYLKPGFLAPLAIVSVISLALLILLLQEEWTRIALFKGMVFSLGCFICFKIYKFTKKNVKMNRVLGKGIKTNHIHQNWSILIVFLTYKVAVTQKFIFSWSHCLFIYR